jgi:hypothetical protein
MAASGNLSFEAAMCLKRPVRVLREIERIAQGCLKLAIEGRFASPSADEGLEIMAADPRR